MAFRIVRNVGSILLSGAAGELFTTAALAVSALALGTAGFGRMNAAQAFMEPFQTLSGFGLGVVAVTFAARRGGCDGALCGTLAGLHARLVAVAGLLVLVAAMLSGRSYMIPMLAVLSLTLATVPINAPAGLPIRFDQAMHRVIWLPAVVGAVRLGLTYAAVSTMNTPVGHLFALALAGLLGVTAMWRVSQHHYPMKWGFDRKLAGELLRLAWPAAVLEVVVVVYSRASYMFLEPSGPVVQGEFAAADRLSRPVLTLAGALAASSLPSVARFIADGGHDRLWSVYARVMGRAAVILGPIVAAVAWFAPGLIGRFAPDYAGAAPIFRVLVVATAFMFLNQLSSMFIVGLGRFRLIMMVALVNLLVYLALAWVLVPRYGGIGAAIATAIMEAANCVQQVVLLWAVLRRRASA